MSIETSTPVQNANLSESDFIQTVDAFTRSMYDNYVTKPEIGAESHIDSRYRDRDNWHFDITFTRKANGDIYVTEPEWKAGETDVRDDFWTKVNAYFVTTP